MSGIWKFFNDLFGGLGNGLEGLGRLIELAPALIVFSGVVYAFSSYEGSGARVQIVSQQQAPPAGKPQ